MEYTTFPNVNSALPPLDTSTNKVNAIQLYGTGSLGGSSGLSFAGSGGINGTQGIWLGSGNFATAPFSVTLQGKVTASSLVVSGAILVGGAAADINSHSTTVSGNKITGASITNSQIANSTITGSNISGGTISASNITSGTITATQISASAGITATQLSVATLSAISANIGTVTAGAINGVTVTGGTLQTASSGQRVSITGATNDVKFFDSSNANSGTIHGQSAGLIVLSNSLSYDNGSGTGQVAFSGSTGSFVWSGSTSTLSVLNLTVSGSKSFDIEHPTKEGYRLRYNAIESDEVLVMCRGTADTEEEIEYPQHFIDVSEPDSIQCQIGKLRGSTKISWFATGVRKGYANYVNEYEGTSPEDYPVAKP